MAPEGNQVVGAGLRALIADDAGLRAGFGLDLEPQDAAEARRDRPPLGRILKGKSGLGSVFQRQPESLEEIDDAWLADAATVGVTAGASTPDDVIEAVVGSLTARGYAPPKGGIRPVDPDYVPAY